jgi:ADP-ribose pyrophosphatase YjhB (NUDIX family)
MTAAFLNTPAGKIYEVATEQRAEINGSFVAFFCRDFPANRATNGQSAPCLLMQLRWDGEFGFPGGTVEAGESLRKACIRETQEEIGLLIREDELSAVCSHMHVGGTYAAHLFALELNATQMLSALRNAWKAEHNAWEVCGLITPRISLSGGESGNGILPFLLRAPMHYSTRNEMLLLFERFSLLDSRAISLIRSRLRSRARNSKR